jgi:lipopolysaccharide export system protein LptA
MRLSDWRSITIVLCYIIMNAAILSIRTPDNQLPTPTLKKTRPLAPDYSEIEKLDYFHLKNSLPQMSLSADLMRSRGEEEAIFTFPRGVYSLVQKETTIRYQADEGIYRKEKELLKLLGKVKITTPESNYEATKVDYFFRQDLLIGTGNVRFSGESKETKDKFLIEAPSMKANPGIRYGHFQGGVNGTMERSKKYEGKMSFSAREIELDYLKSLAHLEGSVNLRRGNYHITSGKADIHLDNFNKSLKYFVLHDDVKVTETVSTPQGVTQRKSFSDRLEGFGRENKMVLSGAPKVEQGTDVIKGYRITIRENADLIEVDDAMSDVQLKRKDKLKE